jgi:hypothetical protein
MQDELAAGRMAFPGSVKYGFLKEFVKGNDELERKIL